MSRRAVPVLAVGAWVVSVLASSGALWLSALRPELQDDPFVVGMAFVLAMLAFSTVGPVVGARRPANAVGWVFSALGLVAALGILGDRYAGTMAA